MRAWLKRAAMGQAQGKRDGSAAFGGFGSEEKHLARGTGGVGVLLALRHE